MQMDSLNQLDGLSPKIRKKLNKQLQRAQLETRKLRALVRQQRRSHKIEIMPKQPQGIFQSINQSWPERGQELLKRGGDMASSGTSAVKAQLDAGQKLAFERGSNLVQGLNQRGSQTSQNLASWRDSATDNLRKQGQSLAQNASDWTDDTNYSLRKRGRSLARVLADWGAEAAYKLRRQSQYVARNFSNRRDEATHNLRMQSRYVLRNLSDRKDETTHNIRKQSRTILDNLADRTEGTTHSLQKQGRSVLRNLADRKDDTAHNLRKQGRSVKRNLSGRKDNVAQLLQEQSQQIAGRGSQFLKHQRKSKVWPVIGFVSGFLLAGGLTFLLVKRVLGQSDAQEKTQIELSHRDNLNGFNTRAGDETRYTSQGNTAVATRPGTVTKITSKVEIPGRTAAGNKVEYQAETAEKAETLNKFVGVLSTRLYYPIEQKPEDQDLVFFTNEAQAKAEGFFPVQ